MLYELEILPDHEHEMSYGCKLPTYNWKDLTLSEMAMLDQAIRGRDIIILERIEDLVCNEFNITLKYLLGKSRAGILPTARFMVWHILNKFNVFPTYIAFANHYNYNNGEAITYGIQTLNNRMENEQHLRDKYTSVLTQLKLDKEINK